MIVLDTNVISELMRPEPDPVVLRWTASQPAEILFVTTISYAEILFGIALLPSGRRRNRFADQAQAMFIEDFAGRILAFDLHAALAFARISAERQRMGRRLSPFDAMIAAIAQVHDAEIATRDGDFAGPGVSVVDPWRPSPG